MSRIGTRRALLYRPPAAGWSPADWWTVAGQTCIAAYQPKGAADLAASYVNLANPGTNNAAPGTAPTFDTATGWTFNAASSQYLDTGLIPATNQTWSIIVRYSDLDGGGVLAGNFNGWSNIFGLAVYVNWDAVDFRNKTSTYVEGIGNPSGIACVAGRQGYLDGNTQGGLIPEGTADYAGRTIYIGAANGGNPGELLTARIQALSVYSTTLSAADVAALTTAMNAL